MSHTVIGLFKNSADAQKAISLLKEKGFESSDIDLSNAADDLTNQAHISGPNDLTGSTNPTDTNRLSNTSYENEDYEKTSPHKQSDGIGRFFSNLFGGEEAETYSDVARRSESIVTVHTQSEEMALHAADLMDIAGAIDAHEEARNYKDSDNRLNELSGIRTEAENEKGFLNETENGLEPERERGNEVERGFAKENGFEGIGVKDSKINENSNESSGATLNVIREDIEVGKKVVETGGLRLKSRIVERPVEESIRLRSEHVTVNRTAVNRPATESDFTSFKEGEVEYKETNEVPVVSKTAQVVEEINLGKEATERTETVKDTVRSTEVDIEKIPVNNNNQTL